MDSQQAPILSELTEAERELAMRRYEFIAPLLGQNKPDAAGWNDVAKQAECSVKTLRRWVKAFQNQGLVGLARQQRNDKGERRSVSPELKRRIEAYFLENVFCNGKRAHFNAENEPIW